MVASSMAVIKCAHDQFNVSQPKIYNSSHEATSNIRIAIADGLLNAPTIAGVVLERFRHSPGKQ